MSEANMKYRPNPNNFFIDLQFYSLDILFQFDLGHFF